MHALLHKHVLSAGLPGQMHVQRPIHGSAIAHNDVLTV
jgi:hypothetical protein